MKIQTLNIKTIEHETHLETKSIRLKTKNALYDIEELADGSIQVWTPDRRLVIVAKDASSVIAVVAPFDSRWIATIGGKAYTE